MYRIKTKFINDQLGKDTITGYAETKWQTDREMESHYNIIAYANGILVEQKVEKGYFTPIKETYKYKLKIDGGHKNAKEYIYEKRT